MKINIVKPVLPDLAEIQEEFQQCLSSGMVTNNSYYVKNYEEALKKILSITLSAYMLLQW